MQRIMRGGNEKSAKSASKLSRPPIGRMMRLHVLLQSGKYPNCRTVAEEFEVTPKTIQRDIDYMRYQLGAEIDYDPVRFGYYYTKPVSQFPMFDISEGEVAALFIAQKALTQYRGTPFEKPLMEACRKLMGMLNDHVSIEWINLQTAVSFRNAAVSPVEMETFDAVCRALADSVEIAFYYHKLGSAQVEMRRAQPWHLGCIQNQWYCFAHDLDRGQIRKFVLPRMSAVKLTQVKFMRPEEFEIEKYLQGSFGVFSKENSGGKLRRIRIRFDAWAARLVAESEWHESQEVKKLVNGEVEITLQLTDFEEVERWILSWGDHARVLAPKVLRERIRLIAKRVAEL
jgi:predicted DNA-binding transcriptional regulator YafY